MNALLLATWVSLAADAKAPEAPKPDPLAQLDDVQVTGWSADETRFSVRAIQLAEGDMGEIPEECPGYIDQNGKHFVGWLVLAAYERGKLLQSWVVQDFPECTPPEKAKATLAKAKAAFAELGIDLKQPGTRVRCDKRCELQHGGASLIFDNATKVSTENAETTGRLKGPVRVWLKTPAAKTQLFARVVNQTFPLSMGGKMVVALHPVELSPTGKSVLVRGAEQFSGGRGGHNNEFLVGFFQWNGDVLEDKR